MCYLTWSTPCAHKRYSKSYSQTFLCNPKFNVILFCSVCTIKFTALSFSCISFKLNPSKCLKMAEEPHDKKKLDDDRVWKISENMDLLYIFSTKFWENGTNWDIRLVTVANLIAEKYCSQLASYLRCLGNKLMCAYFCVCVLERKALSLHLSAPKK